MLLVCLAVSTCPARGIKQGKLCEGPDLDGFCSLPDSHCPTPLCGTEYIIKNYLLNDCMDTFSGVEQRKTSSHPNSHLQLDTCILTIKPSATSGRKVFFLKYGKGFSTTSPTTLKTFTLSVCALWSLLLIESLIVYWCSLQAQFLSTYSGSPCF